MSEKLHQEEIEQNFNDSELEDIMSEIESLEKEFSGEDESEAIDTKQEASLEDISNEDLQLLDADSSEDKEEMIHGDEEKSEKPQLESVEDPQFEENQTEEFEHESEDISEIVAEIEEELSELEENDQKLKFDDIESLEEVKDEFELIKDPDPQDLEKLKVDSFDADKTKLQRNIDSEIETAVASIADMTEHEVSNILNGDLHSVVAEELVPDEDLVGELQELAEKHYEEKVEHHVTEKTVDKNLLPLKDNEMSKSNEKHVSEMNFEVSGNMCMKMNFNLSGKDVVLHLHENEGLTVELPGGIKFTVPLEEKKAS